MKILYEDAQLLVCYKEAGLPVQSARLGVKSLEGMLKTYLKEKQDTGGSYLGVVHRLDQPVQGLVVFARTPKSAAHLSAQAADGRMKKEYLALVNHAADTRHPAADRFPFPDVSRILLPEERLLTDDLVRDGRTNTSRVVPEGTPGAKRAQLYLRTASEEETGLIQIQGKRWEDWNSRPKGGGLSSPCRRPKGGGLSSLGDSIPVHIRLITGRHHQIRVQLANAGLPITGDRKYGAIPAGNERSGMESSNDSQIACDVQTAYHGQSGEACSGRSREGLRFPALVAYHLSFEHPVTGKKIEFALEEIQFD